MTYELRKKFQELSKEAFGGPNKWVKLYQRGYKTDMTEKLEDGTERKYKGTKYQSLEEIEVVMHEMIAKKQEEEAEKKALEVKKRNR